MSSVESPDFERPEDAEDETIEERMDRIEAENERVREENQRIKSRNEELAERVEELAEAVASREVPFRLEADPSDVERGAELLPDLYLMDLPIGESIRNKVTQVEVDGMDDAIESLLDRVQALERGEVDPTDVLAATGGLNEADMIPIHRKHNMALEMSPGSHGLSQNEEIAARIFPYIVEYGHPNEGRLILPSTKVREVIAEEIATPELVERLDVADPNPNTVRRVMKFVAEGSDGMATLNTDRKTNRLEVKADAWKGYLDEVHDRVTQTTEAV